MNISDHDQTFRQAWCIDGGVISIDMPRAREIQRRRVLERGPISVEAEYEIEAARTPDELKHAGLPF